MPESYETRVARLLADPQFVDAVRTISAISPDRRGDDGSVFTGAVLWACGIQVPLRQHWSDMVSDLKSAGWRLASDSPRKCGDVVLANFQTGEAPCFRLVVVSRIHLDGRWKNAQVYPGAWQPNDVILALRRPG